MNTQTQELTATHICEVCGSELKTNEHQEAIEQKDLIRLQILKHYE